MIQTRTVVMRKPQLRCLTSCSFCTTYFLLLSFDQQPPISKSFEWSRLVRGVFEDVGPDNPRIKWGSAEEMAFACYGTI